LAEWLYEAGIGENRAILVEDGATIEAQIELPGLRAGTVADARLTLILVSGRRGIATLGDGTEVLIEPLFKVTEGATSRIEITREAIPEPGAVKRAKGRITDADLCDGPDLAIRIGAHRAVGLHDPDHFEAAGWSECLEEAASGIIAFPGGTLRIVLTPAMTLIDIDGDNACAGATAAARAIRKLDLAGNIGIDLPTVAGKAERQAIATAFDAAMPPPFERTAVNGFGFLQVIRPRFRASLCEHVQRDRAGAAARALLRTAQRSGIVGAAEMVADARMIDVIEANPAWVDKISKTIGGAVSLRRDPTISSFTGSIYRIG
jgi:Ribonuclease G/E